MPSKLHNVYLYCFMDSKQENLIYQFIRYYKQMGIPTQNWKVMLHIKPNCENAVKLLEENGIRYEEVTEYVTNLKRDKANEFIQTISDGWLVYPDLDELFDYEQSLESAVEMCERDGIELIKGVEYERFSENFELTAVTKEMDMFQAFPLCVDFRSIKHEIDQKNINVMLVRITEGKKPVYIDSHDLVDEAQYKKLPQYYKLHHFRWTEYAVDCIKYKFVRYSKEKADQASYYLNLYSMVKKRGGRYYIDIKSQILDSCPQTP